MTAPHHFGVPGFILVNLTINPDQTPCQIANKLVKRLELDVVTISRPGRRNQKRAL